jgi:hypothetical protein
MHEVPTHRACSYGCRQAGKLINILKTSSKPCKLHLNEVKLEQKPSRNIRRDITRSTRSEIN